MNYSYEVIDRILAKEKNIAGIGAKVIGPVDITNGVLLNPTRFYGIHDVHIKNICRTDTIIRFLDHDNNSAALAEKLFGIGKHVEDFIFSWYLKWYWCRYYQQWRGLS